jgi:hypothetical protein
VRLATGDHDGPRASDPQIVADWAATLHAAVGVNCGDCHASQDVGGRPRSHWTDVVSHQACRKCHEQETEGFLAGRHGMRLAVDLPPMHPGDARLPMKPSSFHRELTCVACHGAHRFDTAFAAVDSCLACHDDDHSRAYKSSVHYDLWRQELAGEAPAGTGVSCATCHLPRLRDELIPEGNVTVQHNQNDNLRPNEKMVRSSCMHCHGLEFSLSALADHELIRRNFDGPPQNRVRSLEKARAWFDQQTQKRRERTSVPAPD